MTACTWCVTPFTARQPTARFCSTEHRRNFHEACRLIGERLFAEGVITIEQLRAERGAD